MAKIKIKNLDSKEFKPFTISIEIEISSVEDLVDLRTLSDEQVDNSYLDSQVATELLSELMDYVRAI